MSINITREARPGGGRYVARIDGHEAELVYSDSAPSVVSADHTGVPEALGGRGIGRALVEAMVADARSDGFRIIPRCPFVAAQARRHPDWAPLFVAAAQGDGQRAD